MKFIPFPGQIEVAPRERSAIILSEDKTFVESGEVVAVGDGVTFFKVGDIAYFDAWVCRKATDPDRVDHYVVNVSAEGILGKNEKQ